MLIYIDLEPQKYINMFLWCALKTETKKYFTKKDLDNFIYDFNSNYNKTNIRNYAFVMNGNVFDKYILKNFEALNPLRPNLLYPKPQAIKEALPYVKNLIVYDKTILNTVTSERFEKLEEWQKREIKNLQPLYAKSDFGRYTARREMLSDNENIK